HRTRAVRGEGHRRAAQRPGRGGKHGRAGQHVQRVPAGTGPAGDGMNAQVLCIEDDPDIALAVRLVLRRAGLTVIHAASGEDGLRMFLAERPEVVLLDVGLPAMDGWRVLERIRAQNDTPVMMLTAHGLAADQFRGLHSGADDYLVKPFSNAELTSRVQLLLKQAHAVRPGAARAYQDARLQAD